jgi:hypothetical protein
VSAAFLCPPSIPLLHWRPFQIFEYLCLGKTVDLSPLEECHLMPEIYCSSDLLFSSFGVPSISTSLQLLLIFPVTLKAISTSTTKHAEEVEEVGICCLFPFLS